MATILEMLETMEKDTEILIENAHADTMRSFDTGAETLFFGPWRAQVTFYLRNSNGTYFTREEEIRGFDSKTGKSLEHLILRIYKRWLEHHK